jgi:hypothetical protein
MKTIRTAIVVAACMMAAGSAHAQLGGLGGMLGGGNKANAGASGDIAADVNTFVNKSAALSLMSGRAVMAINAAFASDTELAEKRAKLVSLANITNPKEQLAKMEEVYKSEKAQAQSLLDSGEMEKRMGTLSEEKKKMIGAALLNFGIGSLQAVELTKSGQALVQSAASNPMNLTKVGPVKDALPLLGKVAGDSGSFLVGVAKVARGANITVQAPKVDSKPAPIEV